ncbi:hypothetical protein QFR58_004154 [Escherichia coli]|nr:hypothetical protein [Escherichia coli]EKY5999794.1 hypothetical protein [Escherichia coli]ELO0576669.1 hypothetical protein [Escherichia coli O2]
MGVLDIDSNYLNARRIKECVHIYCKSKQSCLEKQAYLTSSQKGEHKLIKYKLKASRKDRYEHYIYVKDIEGTKTNCGIIFYPYDISKLFSIMKSCVGVAPGKLELHSNLYDYPNAQKQINDSTSPYGFSFLFKNHLAVKDFIEKYNEGIISGELNFNKICGDIKRDDLLIDIYNRTQVNV